MSRDVWNSTQYQRYADERSRPFFDLLARVGATSPATVADLGCGPGNLTVTLAERWPAAVVHGVDSSPDMLQAAARYAVPGQVEFQLGTVQDWQPATPVDVLVSNAALQWVPEHRELFRRLLGQVRPGGWFAFQVPGNFGAPSHVLLREVCRLAPWRDAVGDIPRPDPVAEPAD
ncbi:MAG: methyltransferase domain-containing protein, partial [Candidatus Dormiibacterota bacterium]